MKLAALLKAAIIVISLIVLTTYGRFVVAGALSGACDFQKIREAQAVAPRQDAARTRILKTARELQRDGPYQRWATSAGEFWYPGNFSQLDAFVLSEDEVDFYRTARIRNGAVVLDCGANVGTFTRRALARGAAKVVAIEINPQLQECLRRTFAKEIQQGRVIVYGKGVWDTDTRLDLRGDSVVLKRDSVTAHLLPVTTIDKIVEELALERVDFIKLDIEGAEKNALRGGRHTIERHLPAISIAGEHLDDDHSAIPALITNLSGGKYALDVDQCSLVATFTARPQALHFNRR